MISKTAKMLEKQGVKPDAILKSVICMTASSPFCRAIVANGLEALHKAAGEVKFTTLPGALAARRLDVGLTNIGHERDGSNHAINEINQLLADLSKIQRDEAAFPVTHPKADAQDYRFAGAGVPSGIFTAHGRGRMVSTFTGNPDIDEKAYDLEMRNVRARRPITIAGNYPSKFKKMWFLKRWYNQLKVSYEVQCLMNGYERRMARFVTDYPDEFEGMPLIDDASNNVKIPRPWSHVFWHPFSKFNKGNFIPIYKSKGATSIEGDTFIECWARADGIELPPGTKAQLGPNGGIYTKKSGNCALDAFYPALHHTDAYRLTETLAATSASASNPAKEPGSEQTVQNKTNNGSGKCHTALGNIPEENSYYPNPWLDDDDDVPFDFLGLWSTGTATPAASPTSPIIETDYTLPVNKASQPKKKKEHKKTAWQELISTAESMAVVEGYKEDACYACIEHDVANSTDTADTHTTSECKLFKYVNGVNRHPVHDASCWGCHKPRHDDDDACRKTSDFVFRMASWSLRNPKIDPRGEFEIEC